MAWAIYVSIVLVFSDCFERKGSEILKYYYLRCRKGYTQHAHMYSLSPPSLSLFLSLPVSLSFCETEFYCCTPGWTGIHYVIQTQLANLLPQPVELGIAGVSHHIQPIFSSLKLRVFYLIYLFVGGTCSGTGVEAKE